MRDTQQQFLHCQSPSQRLAHEKFCDDGLLLPFEYSRDGFRFPNPTIFQGHNTWSLSPFADPLCSWSSEEVAGMHMGPVTADLHGRLLFYLREIVRAFVVRLRHSKTSFQIHQLGIGKLTVQLSLNNPKSFARIEAANLIESGCDSVNETLVTMTDLLQPPTENPHTTLVTVFIMDSIKNSLIVADNLQNFGPQSDAIRHAAQTYLPFIRVPTSNYDPDICRRVVAMRVIATWDHVWDRFVKKKQLSETGAFLNAKMKDQHTIVEKWPYQLKLRPGQPGANEEFDRRLSDGIPSKLRYVEWARIHPQDAISLPKLGCTRLFHDLRRLQETMRQNIEKLKASLTQASVPENTASPDIDQHTLEEAIQTPFPE
ncbi:hypothetical protein BDW74DRAFT_176553 [Aspergillus multicolor]|uniref:uncharacterized protein n=1 Tax=Aspergillus multicolor TaxID=41759 RepID=UPI003CCCCD88